MPTKTTLERIIIYAIGGLQEAESQLKRKGCWCPGGGDEQCTLCIVKDVLHVLKTRQMPWALADRRRDES